MLALLFEQARQIASDPDCWQDALKILTQPEISKSIVAELARCRPSFVRQPAPLDSILAALASIVLAAEGCCPLAAHCAGKALLRPVTDTRLLPLRIRMWNVVLDHIPRFTVQWIDAWLDEGNCWAMSPTADRAKNVGRAVECYHDALAVCRQCLGCCASGTRERTDLELLEALLQSNLGDAFLQPTGTDLAQNLERAIEYLQQARENFRKLRCLERWAIATSHLGKAYLQRAHLVRVDSKSPAVRRAQASRRPSPQAAANDIERAISYLREALPQSPRRTEIYVNLGISFASRVYGNPIRNLERAARLFRKGLKEPDAQPPALKSTTAANNLGVVCARLALQYLRRAADAYTRLGRGRDAVIAWTNVALAQTNADDWPGARESLEHAARLVEHEFEGSTSEYSKLEWLRQQTAVFDGLVAGHTLFAWTNDAEAEAHAAQAAFWAEQARARYLAEFASQSCPRGVNAAEYRRYRKNACRLRDLDYLLIEAAERTKSTPIKEDQKATAPRSAATRRRRDRVCRAVERLRAEFADIDPEWASCQEPLGSDRQRAIARQADAALLTLRPTRWGTCAVLVPSDGPVAGQMFPQITTSRVLRWLVHLHGDLPQGGLVLEYERLRGAGDLSQWLAFLDTALGVVGREFWRLLRDWLADGPYPLHTDADSPPRLIVLPGQGLNTLPLHAAWWLENSERRYACDDYQISYAPSVRILERCLIREQEFVERPTSLLAVCNPTGHDSKQSLSWAELEVMGPKTRLRCSTTSSWIMPRRKSAAKSPARVDHILMTAAAVARSPHRPLLYAARLQDFLSNHDPLRLSKRESDQKEQQRFSVTPCRRQDVTASTDAV